MFSSDAMRSVDRLSLTSFARHITQLITSRLSSTFFNSHLCNLDFNFASIVRRWSPDSTICGSTSSQSISGKKVPLVQFQSVRLNCCAGEAIPAVETIGHISCLAPLIVISAIECKWEVTLLPSHKSV